MYFLEMEANFVSVLSSPLSPGILISSTNPRRTLMWQWGSRKGHLDFKLGCGQDKQAALRLASFLSLHGQPTLVDSKEIEEVRWTKPSGLDYATQIGQHLC